MDNEIMKYNLLRLFYNYSMKNKIIDNNYIEELIDIVVKGKTLNNYVSDYRIHGGKVKNDIIAEYDGGSKIINLYSKGLLKHLKEELQYSFTFSENERYLYINLIATQIILHELEHANQRKIMDNENGIEANILKLCEFEDKSEIETLVKRGKISLLEANIYKIKKMDDYIKNYYLLYIYAPHERLAEIKSFQEIIDTLLMMDNCSKRIISFQEANKLANMLRGYDNDSYSPTITYLNTQERNKDLKKFDWYNDNIEETIKLSKEKYKLIDRMNYGLPIDEDEHQYVKELFLDITNF